MNKHFHQREQTAYKRALERSLESKSPGTSPLTCHKDPKCHQVPWHGLFLERPFHKLQVRTLRDIFQSSNLPLFITNKHFILNEYFLKPKQIIFFQLFHFFLKLELSLPNSIAKQGIPASSAVIEANLSLPLIEFHILSMEKLNHTYYLLTRDACSGMNASLSLFVTPLLMNQNYICLLNKNCTGSSAIVQSGPFYIWV